MANPYPRVKKFLVTGVLVTGQRFAKVYITFTAAGAEVMAIDENPTLNVAAIISGRNMKVER